MKKQAEGSNHSTILEESGQYDCTHDEERYDRECLLPERRRGDGCDVRDDKRRHWYNILGKSWSDDEVEGGAGTSHSSVAERIKHLHNLEVNLKAYEKMQAEVMIDDLTTRNKRKPGGFTSASKLKYKGQGRLIDRLANENKILKQRVAHFQLALQLSADKDITSSGADFSGLPNPSPRITRGRIHKESLARESGSSDAYSAHQMKTSGKRVRVLDEVNEALAARVKELENSRTVRNNSTKGKLALQEQEIASLREELAVMHSLARAQDRKFDGSEGYAMARRLWTVENELRIAKEAASSSIVELARLRQYKYTRCRAQGVRRDPDDSPTTGESHFSPHRPAVLPRQSFPRVKAEKVERGDEERGITRGARTIQTVASIQDEKREEKEEENPLRHRIRILERSLANMRNKAQEELRAMKEENGRLKKGTGALSRDLNGKAKGVQMKLQQSENTRHRTHGARRGSDDSSAGESRLSPQRPAVPPQQSSPNAHQTIPRVNAVKVARGNTEEAISRGARTVRTVAATQGKQKRDEESLPIRVKILERALTNMRSKARGELREVKAENAHLKKEMSALSRDLDGKAKEVQKQLQQVIRLKKQLLQLSGSMAVLGRDPVPAAAARRVFPMKGAPVIAAGDRQLGPSNETDCSSLRSLEIADQVQGNCLDKGRQHEALTLVKSSALHSCPLSGILDMSEPALRRNRGNSFADDGNVTPEPSRSCNSGKCIVDFDGSVCHGDACVLKNMDQGYPTKVKPVEDLAALQDWSRLAPENGSLPIQKDGSTVDLPAPEVPVLGLDKGRLSLGSRQHSPRNSCVSLSGETRLKPTMEILRRPTNFSVESVHEENADE